MSRSEKRYFKIFAGKSATDQNYLKVFAAFEKIDSYNEKELIQSLANDSLARQFPVLKNYLYKLILKSLRNFKADKSIDFQIKELLMNAQLLMDRDLLAQSKKQLEKAHRLVKSQERFEYMSEIGNLRTTLVLKMAQERLDGVSEQLNEIATETNRIGNLMLEVEAYRLISLQLLVLNRKEAYIRSDEIRKVYQEYDQSEILSSPPPKESVRAGLYFHQSKAITNVAFSDYEAALHHFDSLIQLMENNPWTIKYSPENYLHSLQNRISLSLETSSPEKTLDLLQQLRQVAESNSKILIPKRKQLPILLFGFQTELELLMQESRLDEAAVLVDLIRTTLDSANLTININEGYTIIQLYQCLVYYYLATNQLRDGLHFANLIINTPEISTDYQIFLDTQLLKIILTFELKEIEVFESALQNLYRFLLGHKKLHRFEKAIFEYLRKRMKLTPGTALRPYIQELYDALKVIKDDPNDSLGLRPFDVLIWLEKVIASNPGVNLV